MIGKNSMKHHYLKNYRYLNMEDITDVEYEHAKGDCKDFEMRKLGNIMIYMFKAIHYCDRCM